MIFACGTAAFAAGAGNLRFSAVNIAINGQTVIRTFRAEAYTGGLDQPDLSFTLHNNPRADNSMDEVKATVSVVSFDPNRTGLPLFS